MTISIEEEGSFGPGFSSYTDKNQLNCAKIAPTSLFGEIFFLWVYLVSTILFFWYLLEAQNEQQ